MVSVSPSLLFSMSATGQSGRTSPARPAHMPSASYGRTQLEQGQALTPAQDAGRHRPCRVMRSRNADAGPHQESRCRAAQWSCLSGTRLACDCPPVPMGGNSQHTVSKGHARQQLFHRGLQLEARNMSVF